MGLIRQLVHPTLCCMAFAVATFAAPAAAVPTAPAGQGLTAGRSIAPATKAEVQTIHAVRKRVLATAMTKTTATYQWGAAGPDRFDCSGFVLWTYLTATGISLPHYSGAQMDVTRPVARTRLRKGDLLFYGADGSSHVTMYLGRRLQIGASNSRDGIVVDSIDSPYWVANYAGAGRVIRLTNIRTGLR